MSRIWTPLRLREVRLVREERVEMSLIGFPLRASSVRLVQYCRQEISAIPLFPAHSVVSLASSAAVISSPSGLPRASLMAASRFWSGKVTVSDALGVTVGAGVGVGVVVGVAGVSLAHPGCIAISRARVIRTVNSLHCLTLCLLLTTFATLNITN